VENSRFSNEEKIKIQIKCLEAIQSLAGLSKLLLMTETKSEVKKIP